MKILVTGGAGFIGTNLIKRLLEEGHDVSSLDNYSIGTKENEQEGCNYITGDIDALSWMNGIGFDQCYHLASLSRIQPSFENPVETFQVNTIGTQIVMDWASRNNIKIVYAGSSSVHHNPYQSPYATTKYLGEEICKMYENVYNLDVSIARFYNVYGPHEIKDGKWAALIGKWRGMAERGEALPIVGDGEQRRDFTHVDDIVDGLIKIMAHGNLISNWELGTGSNYSINEVYDMFRKKFGATREYIQQQNGNYQVTKRENDDALDELDWKPTDRLKEYIENL